MEILKFNENVISEDRVFHKYTKNALYQRHITYYNSIGYKLYYYKNFNLIEITKVTNSSSNTWGKNWDVWGDMIFFLNDEEYKNSMKLINKSKELYDAHLKQIGNIKKMPMAYIYHDILKLK